MNSKNPSTESQQLLTPPNELQSGEVSPIRRKMGGSYSRYTGAAPLHRGLTIELEGDLVDSSGRKINKFGGITSFLQFPLTPTFSNIQVSRR